MKINIKKIFVLLINKKRKKAQELERQNSRTLGNILNNIDALIYATIPETGEILFVNRKMRKFLNMEDDDLIGKYCYVIFRGIDKMCGFCPCHQLKKNPDNNIVWEEYVESSNLHIRHSDCYIDWPDGSKVHLQHAVDITELVNSKEEALQSSRFKSAFLANMSHEIRTPMNAILGIAEIQLQNKTLSPAIEDAFTKIYESGDLLLNIINDILDLSKIEAGKLELVNDKYDISSLINDTAQLNRLRYESNPVEFEINIDENTPHDLYGDELRIKQILNNILSNAFKYTKEGKVVLSVFSEPAVFENVTLVLRISDTGQGMTKEQTNKLFDEYQRFNIGANRTTVGTGLGMTITKRLVSLMGGEIYAESELGKGSSFTVRIPQKQIGEAVCGSELAVSLRNFSYNNSSIAKKTRFLREYMPYGSVLLVDDVESNLYVAKGMLIPYGLKIELASSGFEAIDKIKNGNEYDIIFMDHMMPKMDGIETTKIIRGMGYARYIIALTANALVGQAEIFLHNGFDGFISKPIDSRELNMVLNDFIRNKKTPEVVEAARKEQRERTQNTAADSAVKAGVDPQIIKFFIKDAKNALSVLEELNEKIMRLGEAEIDSFVTAVHGIKSALANINEMKLSADALKLEQAGRERNFTAMSNGTAALINELHVLIEKFKPRNEDCAAEISGDDAVFLMKKLPEINKACSVLNKTGAKTAIKDLKQKKWPAYINNVLDEISVHLLHSDFTEAANLADSLAHNLADTMRQ